MEERVRRIIEWTEKGRSNPFKVDVFLTHRCNLKCRFCNYPGTDPAEKGRELSRQRLLDIVAEAAEMKPVVFGILGGEPFVRRDCVIDFMRAVRSGGMEGSLVTNGTLLGKADVKAIVEMQWNLFRFSIDGARPETHDRLRGMPGSFEKAFSAMREMCGMKREAGSRLPAVEVNYVLCRENYLELPELVRLAAEAGASGVVVLPMIELTAEVKDLQVRRAERGKVVEALGRADEEARSRGLCCNARAVAEMRLYEKADSMNEVLRPEEPESGGREGQAPCFLPWLGMSFDALGKASPCGQLRSLRHDNVKDASLAEIWNGDMFRGLRDSMLRGRMPRECSQCCTPLVEENVQIRAELGKRGVVPFKGRQRPRRKGEAVR